MAEFVFLPDENADVAASLAALGAAVAPAGFEAADGMAAMAAPSAGGAPRGRGRRAKPKVRVVDVSPESGAALVVAPSRSNNTPPPVPGGKLYKVVRYELAVARIRVGRTWLSAAMGPVGAAFFKLDIRSSANGAPLAGAVATLRLKGSNQEITAVSDAAGMATFGLRAPAVSGAMLLVAPGFAGHWGYFNRKADLASGDRIDLDPIDLAAGPDGLRHLMTPGAANSGSGVVVGVVDSGVGPHPDLPTALGDPDSSIGHGTHVAGIIAGAGSAGYGGIAPGAQIRSYRVFDDPATGTTRNFEIHKAIQKAVSDGCHLINLSLKVEKQLVPQFDDPVISKAINDASKAGVLIVAAAGNDFHRFAAFPARHPDVVSVSAVGWEPGLPDNAYDRWTVSTDRSTVDAEIFFASFSNEGTSGTKVDITAPGAGVVSTVPGNLYAPMSGTSMACPAAVGAIARLLAANPAVLAMPPDRARRDAMWALVAAKLKPLGLGREREGAGLIS